MALKRWHSYLQIFCFFKRHDVSTADTVLHSWGTGTGIVGQIKIVSEQYYCKIVILLQLIISYHYSLLCKWCCHKIVALTRIHHNGLE